MIAGKFYTYNVERNIYADSSRTKKIDEIKQDEPFIYLGKDEKLILIENCKVLTINGVVGWILIGYPDHIKAVNT
jgi:hypothetical protein